MYNYVGVGKSTTSSFKTVLSSEVHNFDIQIHKAESRKHFYVTVTVFTNITYINKNILSRTRPTFIYNKSVHEINALNLG